MAAVKRGGNRQVLHEALRVHSQAAATAIKKEGAQNDLVARIASDPRFDLTIEEIEAQLEPSRYIGRSVEQVEDFLKHKVWPMLKSFEGTQIQIDLKV